MGFPVSLGHISAGAGFNGVTDLEITLNRSDVSFASSIVS